LVDDYDITPEEAGNLLEILKKSVGGNGGLIKFTYHQRPRIIATFMAHYHCLVTGQVCDRVAEVEATVEPVEEVSTESVGTELETAGKPPALQIPTELDESALQDLAYKYSLLVTDVFGRALVSLFEIEKHLSIHATDPMAAISTAVDELLHVPMPSPPPRKPTPPPPSDWVYIWLKEMSLEQYADEFIGQGISTLDDLVTGEELTDDILENKLGVKKLGHRWKIRKSQKKLVTESAKLSS